eukprot:10425964-Alexandrium_andersonii.AAC.1
MGLSRSGGEAVGQLPCAREPAGLAFPRRGPQKGRRTRGAPAMKASFRQEVNAGRQAQIRAGMRARAVDMYSYSVGRDVDPRRVGGKLVTAEGGREEL